MWQDMYRDVMKENVDVFQIGGSYILLVTWSCRFFCPENLAYFYIGDVHQNKRMKTLLNYVNIMNSKRQSSNLKNILNKARCGNCGTCQHSSVTFRNNVIFHVRCDLNCSARNVIYVITFIGYKQHNIGHTEYLRGRTRVPKYQIQYPELRFIPLNAHFDKCAREKQIKFTFCFLLIKTIMY